MVYSGESRSATRFLLENGYLKDVLAPSCLDGAVIISDSKDMEHPFTPSALPEDFLVESTSSRGLSTMEVTDAAPKKEISKGAARSDEYQSVLDLLDDDPKLISQVLETYDFKKYYQWCLYGILFLLASHFCVRYCLHDGSHVRHSKGRGKVKRPPPPSMLRSICHMYVACTGHLLWFPVYLWQSAVCIWRVFAQAVVLSMAQLLASVTWSVRQLSSAVVWSRELWKSLCGIMRGFWGSKRGSGERTSSSRATMDAKTLAGSIAVGSSSSNNNSMSSKVAGLDSSTEEAQVEALTGSAAATVEASGMTAAASNTFTSGDSIAFVPGSTEGCNGATAAAGGGDGDGTGSTAIASDESPHIYQGTGTGSSGGSGRCGSSSSGSGGNSSNSSSSGGSSSSSGNNSSSGGSSGSSSNGFFKMTSQPSGSSCGDVLASDTSLVTDQTVLQGRDKGSSWAGLAGASVSSNCTTSSSSSSGAPCQPDVTSADAAAGGTGLRNKKQQKQQQQQGVVVPAGTRSVSTASSSSSVGGDGSRALGYNAVAAPVTAKATTAVSVSRPHLTAATARIQPGMETSGGAAKLDAKGAAGCQSAANQQVLAGSKGPEQAAGVNAVNFKQAVKAPQARTAATAVGRGPGTRDATDSSVTTSAGTAAAAVEGIPGAGAAELRPTTLAKAAVAGAAPKRRAQTRKIGAAHNVVQAVTVPSLPSATPAALAAVPSSSSSTGVSNTSSLGKGRQSSSSSSESKAGSSSAAAVRAAASNISSSYGIANQSSSSCSSSSSAAAGPVHMWSFLEQIQVEAQQQQLQQVGRPTCQQFPGATATTSLASAAGNDGGAAQGRATAAASASGTPGQAFKGKSKNVLGSRWLCVVCMCEPRGVVLLPCRHMVLCRGCSARVEAQGSGCPLCQQGVEKHLVVHRS